jgi:hypothetical protein
MYKQHSNNFKMNGNQPMPREFTLNVNDIVYFIKPVCDVDYIYYEVSTDREKLFTLQLFADGHWKTVEIISCRFMVNFRQHRKRHTETRARMIIEWRR